MRNKDRAGSTHCTLPEDSKEKWWNNLKFGLNAALMLKQSLLVFWGKSKLSFTSISWRWSTNRKRVLKRLWNIWTDCMSQRQGPRFRSVSWLIFCQRQSRLRTRPESSDTSWPDCSCKRHTPSMSGIIRLPIRTHPWHKSSVSSPIACKRDMTLSEDCQTCSKLGLYLRQGVLDSSSPNYFSKKRWLIPRVPTRLGH